MGSALPLCDAIGRSVSVLVDLIATVAYLCAVFATAFVLGVWALERPGGETPSDVLAACHEGTDLRCALAVLWRSRDVLARLICVSCGLAYVVLRRGSEDGHDDYSEGPEEEEDDRGQASASTREGLVRHPFRAPTARATSAEQVHEMAPGTATPPLLVLPETGAVANTQQPATGRSAVSRRRVPTSSSSPQGQDASRSRSAWLSRSTGPLVGTRRDAVRVSLSRSGAGPPGGARRASNDPTGQRQRMAPAGRSRRVLVSSGSLFYENVVLRQLRELPVRAYDDSSDDGDGS